MIDHLGLAVIDIGRSRRFYAAALAPLGYRIIADTKNDAGHSVVLMGVGETVDFVIGDGERPGEGSHVAFRAANRAEVDAFHAAALAAGGRDHGAPGLRPQYGTGYYAAFVLDADGINVEAVFHEERG
ncbi:catechol 2,3-dioxygenase-like lactoylglutathione lyase family enzyme [Sphingomonas jinjuensis]|uniref:Catechol 2,3-dioxygenase-like lactoylglutathione lyase family enzyme n=1 Tax=Sphingomonas jinjuensis TaxID=535907 RepID=A0A840FJV3_9SPHN|nr:VOC family protein [Sphingomonas jinjuensis]MBB4154238.1 catechol 2,3-dioxygenase-like lactoylglutathione lyase family enzyme [Sphingomonas jinjuensis]